MFRSMEAVCVRRVVKHAGDGGCVPHALACGRSDALPVQVLRDLAEGDAFKGLLPVRLATCRPSFGTMRVIPFHTACPTGFEANWHRPMVVAG